MLSALSPLPVGQGERMKVRVRSQVRHFALYDPTLPLSLAKGEATRVRGAYSIYQNAS